MKTLLVTLSTSLLLLAGFQSASAAGNNPGERVWIHYNKGKAAQVQQQLGNANAKVHYHFSHINAFAASVPTGALSGLRNNPNVTLIEADPKRYPSAQTVPYGIDKVQARDIWDTDHDNVIDSGAPTGSGRLVCIIDSGIHAGHEDFAGVNLVGGYPAGWDTDTCGHGSHVAGTIAAANNNTGVVGVSPGKTSLYIVKVFDGPSCGWSYSSDLVDAAQRCQAAGANIISMSLGGTFSSKAEDNAFAAAYANGVLSIAAAGNDGNTRKSYPASYASVVSVAAVDSNNVVADFSQQNSAVEIAAPGVGILSSVPWKATSTITVNGSTYTGSAIEFAAQGSGSGAVANGGLCDATGAWSGKVVMCERGVVSFYDKVMNAQNSGATAVIIYNNVAGGFAGTLGTGNTSAIPAISLSQEDGQLIIANNLGQNGSVVNTVTQPDSGYEAWDGTSMATPHVSGAAAVIWSANPSLTNDQIRTAIQNTALDLGAAGRDSAYGFGLIQARDAWIALGGGSTPTNNPPTASFSYNCTDLNCSFDASASTDSDGSIVSYAWNFGDGANGSGVTIGHSYASANSYQVSLTVTDNQGAISTSSQTVTVTAGGGGGGTAGPVISNVTSLDLNGPSFAISWTTDIPSNSVVTFTCCGTYSNSTMVTSHYMSFQGSNGALYEYYVSSTDAGGNTTTEGPFYHQN
ncbi:MAG: S8 family serine peptidase [Gammaproteobacteria bacterium]|nr:S8 family serine peptidase [Gammaproteobacteria bacterium]